MASLKKTGKTRKKLMFRRWLTGISAVVFVIVALAFAYVSFKGQTDPRQQAQLKTAIIDQLSRSHPNRTFWCAARTVFNESGYEMYYFMGGSDTVNFYRTLPERDFTAIILRAHSAIHPESGDLAIFTSEGWDDGRASTTYLADILNDRLARVMVDVDSPAYFGITPNFVRAMHGNFKDTVIIMMGCDGLTDTSMAEAFIQKGAKVYIGWTGPVEAGHTDAVTLRLLQHLISERHTISQAISETLDEVGEDPYYGSSLNYYPLTVGDLTITQTGKGTQSISNYMSTITIFWRKPKPCAPHARGTLRTSYSATFQHEIQDAARYAA